MFIIADAPQYKWHQLFKFYSDQNNDAMKNQTKSTKPGDQKNKAQQDQRGAQDQHQRGQDQGVENRQGNDRSQNQGSQEATYREDQSLGNQSLADESQRSGGDQGEQGKMKSAEPSISQPGKRGPEDARREENEDNLEDLALKNREGTTEDDREGTRKR